jgi:MFS family permease
VFDPTVALTEWSTKHSSRSAKAHDPAPVDSLKGRNWRLWLTATCVNNVGDGASQMGFQILASSLAGGARGVATVLGANQIGLVVASPIAGVLGDRWNRRHLMIRTNFVRGILVAIAGLMVITDVATVTTLAAIYFVLGSAEALIDGVAEAVVPTLVDDEVLDRAFARQYGAEATGNTIIGPPLGGLLTWIWTPFTFVIDAISYIAVALGLRTIPGNFGTVEGEGPSTSLRQELRAGVSFLWRSKVLRTISFGVLVMNLGYGAIGSHAISLTTDQYGYGASWLGVLMLGTAFGALAVDPVLSRLERRVTPARTVRIGGLLAAAAAITAVSTHVFIIGVICLAVMMFGLFTALATAAATRQRQIPEDLKARVGSVYRMFAFGGTALGTIVGGALIETYDVRVSTLAAAGTIGIGIIIVSTVVPSRLTGQSDEESLSGLTTS